MITSAQVREFEAEVKRLGEEVTSSLKRILPSTNNNNNNTPRHSLPALRHTALATKRWSLDDSSLGAGSIGLSAINHRFFTLPLQHLMQNDGVS